MSRWSTEMVEPGVQLKFTGEVTYRGWENGPAGGTKKEVSLTLTRVGVASASFNQVTADELNSLIEDLVRIKEELENAPMKNAWG